MGELLAAVQPLGPGGLCVGYAGSDIARDGLAGCPGSTGGRTFDIYYDRAPKDIDHPEGQWFLRAEL